MDKIHFVPFMGKNIFGSLKGKIDFVHRRNKNNYWSLMGKFDSDFCQDDCVCKLNVALVEQKILPERKCLRKVRDTISLNKNNIK